MHGVDFHGGVIFANDDDEILPDGNKILVWNKELPTVRKPHGERAGMFVQALADSLNVHWSLYAPKPSSRQAADAAVIKP